MSKLSAARIATLKANGGKGMELDAKWRRSRAGDCFIEYDPSDDRWYMWSLNGANHNIAGDSSVERINAHWRGFVANNKAAA